MKNFRKILTWILSLILLVSCSAKNIPISDLTREQAEAYRACPACDTRDKMQKSIKPIIGKRVHWTNQISKAFKGEPAFGRGDWIVVVWYMENKEDRNDYMMCILEDIPPETIKTLNSGDIITFEGTISGLLDDEYFPFWILRDVEIVSVEKRAPN